MEWAAPVKDSDTGDSSDALLYAPQTIKDDNAMYMSMK